MNGSVFAGHLTYEEIEACRGVTAAMGARCPHPWGREVELWAQGWPVSPGGGTPPALGTLETQAWLPCWLPLPVSQLDASAVCQSPGAKTHSQPPPRVLALCQGLCADSHRRWGGWGVGFSLFLLMQSCVWLRSVESAARGLV